MCCPQASPHVCISKLSENAILVVCRSRTSGIRWIFLSLLLVALWHAHANNNFVVRFLIHMCSKGRIILTVYTVFFYTVQVFSIGLIVVIALAWFKLTETQEEHVLYLRGIGYQLKRKTRMGLQRGNFFAADRLQSVVIHEGFER